MRILSTLVVTLLFSVLTFAEIIFFSDPVESYVEFEVNHLAVLPVIGRVEGMGAVFVFENSESISRIEARLNSNSIYTKNSIRDRRLRRKKYFDSIEHPHITFKAMGPISITDTEINGTLNVKGKSVKVTVPVKIAILRDTITNAYVLSVESDNFVVSRSELGFGGSSFLIDDAVNLRIKVIAKPMKTK